MTERGRTTTGRYARRTVPPGRARPGTGIVWLDRVSLVGPGGGQAPPRAASAPEPDGERRQSVRATVEVPPGYLVVDVRVGYGAAAATFVSELRVVDLLGRRKSALVFLDGDGRGDDALPLDARPAAPGERTFLSIEAWVADGADHVAVRGLRVHLARS